MPVLLGRRCDWVDVVLKVSISALISLSLRLGGLLVQIIGGDENSGIVG